jgi:molecular chaperone HtpG
MMPTEKKETEESEGKKEEREQVNKTQSLRSKNKKNVTEQEHQEFYTSLTFDQEKPLDHLHIHVEGAINYKAILYIPQKINPMA